MNSIAPIVFEVPADLDGRPLDGALRVLARLSWGRARALVANGKVFIDGRAGVDVQERVHEGQTVEIRPNAPRRAAGRQPGERPLVIFADAQVVVARKPAGVSTVPYDESERDTFDRLVARTLQRGRKGAGPAMPLGVVHRLDKETSGLLVFARTFAAKKILAQQFRLHTIERRYLAIAHGSVTAKTYESRLVADRGDGLRGSTRLSNAGVRAVTHVEPLERLTGATLIRCRLETGKTHQIRIHLSEDGHPIVGERVYIRGYRGTMIGAPRLMLHAAELGFTHPTSGRPLRFEDPPPPDFEATLRALRQPPRTPAD